MSGIIANAEVLIWHVVYSTLNSACSVYSGVSVEVLRL
jgi:hypothetical protein